MLVAADYCIKSARAAVNVHIKCQNGILVTLTALCLLVSNGLVCVTEKLLISWDFHAKQTTATKKTLAALLMGEVKEKSGKVWTGSNYSNSNNYSLQPRWAEKHLYSHQMLKSTLGCTPVSYEQERVKWTAQDQSEQWNIYKIINKDAKKLFINWQIWSSCLNSLFSPANSLFSAE